LRRLHTFVAVEAAESLTREAADQRQWRDAADSQGRYPGDADLNPTAGEAHSESECRRRCEAEAVKAEAIERETVQPETIETESVKAKAGHDTETVEAEAIKAESRNHAKAVEPESVKTKAVESKAVKTDHSKGREASKRHAAQAKTVDAKAAEASDRKTAEPSDRKAAEASDRKAAEPSDRKTAEPSDRKTAEAEAKTPDVEIGRGQNQRCSRHVVAAKLSLRFGRSGEDHDEKSENRDISEAKRTDEDRHASSFMASFGIGPANADAANGKDARRTSTASPSRRLPPRMRVARVSKRDGNLYSPLLIIERE
jgi:hypothetical protein